MALSTYTSLLFILFFAACSGVKTHPHYRKVLPEVRQVAVLTPYVVVHQLTRNNDFEKEKRHADSLQIGQGTSYIQQKITQVLPSSFAARAHSLTPHFTQVSQKDIEIFFDFLEKKCVEKVNVPAYVKEFLLQEKIPYAVISYYKGFYKTKLRNKQDEVVYNAHEALEGVFSATSVPEPLFPNDVVGTLHLVLYDVKTDRLLYYSKEVNSELAIPDVPIYPKAIDAQMTAIIKKLQKDVSLYAQ